MIKSLFKTKNYTNFQLKIIANLKKLLDNTDSKCIITRDESYVENEEMNLRILIYEDYLDIKYNNIYIKDNFPRGFIEKLREMITKRKLEELESLKKDLLRDKSYLQSTIFNEL